jgi:hydroxyacylglutathione hydrolase
MTLQTHPIHLGLSVAFLLQGGKGPVLLDAGVPGSERRIWAQMQAKGFCRQDLHWIVLTHAHFDHCGCLPALLQGSEACLAAHPLAAAHLRGGRIVVPPPRKLRGKAMAALFRLMCRFFSNPQAQVARPLPDGSSLADMGLPARVLHTPGHTADSISIILEDGTAFVGDLVGAAGRRACPQPYFVEDDAALTASLVRLQWEHPRRLYSSHYTRPLEPPW